MQQAEVSKFIIVAPERTRSRLLDAGERFASWMEGEFPDYEFMVLDEAPGGGEPEEVIVIPIVNEPRRQQGDEIRMCKPLDRGIILAIARRLAGFDLTGARLN